MFGLPLSPEEKAERAERRKALPSNRFPSVTIAGHRVHVFDAGDGWECWLNTESQDFDGLCIGGGSSRDEAVGDAVASLEAVVAFLQRPPAPAA